MGFQREGPAGSALWSSWGVQGTLSKGAVLASGKRPPPTEAAAETPWRFLGGRRVPVAPVLRLTEPAGETGGHSCRSRMVPQVAPACQGGKTIRGAATAKAKDQAAIGRSYSTSGGDLSPMKVHIHLDPACAEPTVTITAARLTPQLQALAQRLESEDRGRLLGWQGEQATPLDSAAITRFYAQDRGVFCQDTAGVTYALRLRL